MTTPAKKPLQKPKQKQVNNIRLKPAPGWVYDSFLEKFDKRWAEIVRCETLRTIAREPNSHRRPDYISPESLNKAAQYYSTLASAHARRNRGSAMGSRWPQPYDRTLVTPKWTFARTLYLKANWVRTMYDEQWWIVVARSQKVVQGVGNGRENSPIQLRTAEEFYMLLLLFFGQQRNLPAYKRTIDPPPHVWITLTDTEDYPSELLVPPPPSLSSSDGELPELRVHVRRTLSTREYIRREFTITASGSGTTARVVQYAYRGGWPDVGAQHKQLTNNNTECVHNVLDFLVAVDGEVRRSARPDAPILITQDTVSESEGIEALRPRAGALMVALSVLRASNIGKTRKYHIPKMKAELANTPVRRQLEATWKTQSPLHALLTQSTGRRDKVLQETNNILNQCPFVFGADVLNCSDSTATFNNLARQAVRLVYWTLITEDRGLPRPSMVHQNQNNFQYPPPKKTHGVVQYDNAHSRPSTPASSRSSGSRNTVYHNAMGEFATPTPGLPAHMMRPLTPMRNNRDQGTSTRIRGTPHLSANIGQNGSTRTSTVSRASSGALFIHNPTAGSRFDEQFHLSPPSQQTHQRDRTNARSTASSSGGVSAHIQINTDGPGMAESSRQAQEVQMKKAPFNAMLLGFKAGDKGKGKAKEEKPKKEKYPKNQYYRSPISNMINL